MIKPAHVGLSASRLDPRPAPLVTQFRTSLGDRWNTLREIYTLWNISKKYFGRIRPAAVSFALNTLRARSMIDSVTFAIGDIHGCFEKLESLIATCELLSGRDNARWVFIGDYVDRGPNTREVINFLIQSQTCDPKRFICLRGNHEAMLIAAAKKDRSDRDLMNWWANGGQQTLDSYGINDPGALPAEHLAWMKTLPLTFSDRKRLYVHAGVRPGVSIKGQTEKDLLWIREPFLSSDDDHGALVVHGHTPTASRLPDLRSNRLNIDTGACFGGPLTAALFTAAQHTPSLFCNSSGDFWQP